LLATLACGNCVPQARHQRRGARPPRLCRPQAASFVKEATRVHRIPPRVRHVRATPLLSGQDEHCFGGDLGSGTTKIFFQKGLDRGANHFCFSEIKLPSPKLSRRAKICKDALSLDRTWRWLPGWGGDGLSMHRFSTICMFLGNIGHHAPRFFPKN
jgi:hypothetical protein